MEVSARRAEGFAEGEEYGAGAGQRWMHAKSSVGFWAGWADRLIGEAESVQNVLGFCGGSGNNSGHDFAEG